LGARWVWLYSRYFSTTNFSFNFFNH